MKNPRSYYFFIILIVFAFLESTIWPANLVFLLLAIWSFLRKAKEVLITAFFAGLVLDFLAGVTLGTTSIGFVSLLSVGLFVRSKFFPKNLSAWKILPFLMVYVFLASLVLSIFINWLTVGKFSLFFIWQAAFWEVTLTIFAYPIFEFLSLRWEKEDDFQLQLKV